MPADFYDLLGVTRGASEEEIKQAYRRRVREYHPDVNDADRAEAQFKLVRRAHDTLSDPAERKDYDRLGHRDYVAEQLPNAPPLSVFDEPEPDEDRTATGSAAAEATTTDAGPDRGPGSSGRGHPRSSFDGRGSSDGSATGDGVRAGSSPKSASARATAETTDGATDGAGAAASTTSASTASSASTSATSSTSSSTTSTTSSPGAAPGATPGSTGASEVAARRRSLRRWYLLVVAAFAGYLAGLGAYVRANYSASLDLARAVAADPAALLAPAGLSEPLAYAVSAATAGSVGLLFPVGALLLAAVLGATVARFGRGWAYLYVVGGATPAAAVFLRGLFPSLAAVDVAAFLVFPVVGAGAFLVDVGRYLLASR